VRVSSLLGRVQDKQEEKVCQSHLANEQLHQLLEQVDADLAEAARQGPCRYCGGKLHRADYDRKPRGGPQWDQRSSFCCAQEGCRRRLTPASVRFLGRRVYAGVVVVLVSALSHGLSATRVQRLREALGIDRRTLERWRQWWLETFVQSPFWKAARGRLMPPVDPARLPWPLWERFEAHFQNGVVKLLQFLAPLTGPRSEEGAVM